MNIVFERTHHKDSKFYDYFGRVNEFEFLINIEDCGDICKVEQRSYLGDCSNEIYRRRFEYKNTIQDLESKEMVHLFILQILSSTYNYLSMLAESLDQDHQEFLIEIKESKDND